MILSHRQYMLKNDTRTADPRELPKSWTCSLPVTKSDFQTFLFILTEFSIPLLLLTRLELPRKALKTVKGATKTYKQPPHTRNTLASPVPGWVTVQKLQCMQAAVSREDTFPFSFRGGAVPWGYQGSCPPQRKLHRFWVVTGPFISLPFQRKYETKRHLLCLCLGTIRRSQKEFTRLEVLPWPSWLCRR